MLHIPVYILSEWAQSMKWQRFTPKFPLPIPFFSRSPYITILNTGAHYMLVRNGNFNCNCFSPPPALEINNNIDIPEDEKFSPIKKRKIDFDLNGITRHAIFEIPKDTRKPAKNKNLSASDKFYETIYEGPTLSCTSCNKLYYPTTIKTYDIQDSWRSIVSILISPQNTAGLFCDRCIKCLKQEKCHNIAEQKMISMAHAYMKVVI